MLKEIIKVSENSSDDFVGLKFIDGNPSIIFPRGYALSDDEKQIRKDIIKLIAAIQKFSGRKEGENIKNKIGEFDLSMPILSYQYIIYDFIAHGYYTEKETHYVGNTRGKIGWLFLGKEAKPKKPSIKFNKRIFSSVLKDELNNTFNDQKRHLFQAMLNIVNDENETINENFNAVFGVNRFEYVWEGMVDYVFGEDNKDEYFPHAKWHIVKDGGYSIESSTLEPDTIMLYDDKCYILDAKYYKFGITGNPQHLPGTASIEKQIVYGEYIEHQNKFYYDDTHIYNAFIMPFNANEWGCETLYKFVSVGTADWKPVNSKKNYEYVLGILVDTRFLVESYSKHKISEIEKLSNLIIESLDDYRDIN